MYRTVVTICTAQWSLYVQPSGHYMYRTVVTVCIAQWSLYIPHSGHYMYRTVVTICTAQRSLYVPHSGHYITICTTSLTFNNSTRTFCPHSVFGVLCGYQNKQRLFPYTTLTDWFLCSVANLRKPTISFVMSVRPSVRLSSWNNSAQAGRIFMKFDIGVFF